VGRQQFSTLQLDLQSSLPSAMSISLSDLVKVGPYRNNLVEGTARNEAIVSAGLVGRSMFMCGLPGAELDPGHSKAGLFGAQVMVRQ
jgi:hypothetical protein